MGRTRRGRRSDLDLQPGWLPRCWTPPRSAGRFDHSNWHELLTAIWVRLVRPRSPATESSHPPIHPLSVEPVLLGEPGRAQPAGPERTAIRSASCRLQRRPRGGCHCSDSDLGRLASIPSTSGAQSALDGAMSPPRLPRTRAGELLGLSWPPTSESDPSPSGTERRPVPEPARRDRHARSITLPCVACMPI
jgi:hypothetical protein